MGYDMTWVTEPPEMQADAAAARGRVHEACAARDALPDGEQGQLINRDDWYRDDLPLDAYEGRSERYHAAQDAVRAAMQAWDAAQPYYFRLNVSGMSKCCALMDRFDMIYRSTPNGDWPDAPDGFEYPHDDVYELEEAGTPIEEWPAPLREWKAAQDEHLASGVQERPGIAVHKFGSNDGWIVTPIECLGAVEQWKRAVLGPPELSNDRRVGTLLAKATDRATTTFESEAFTAKALELMAEHDLPGWWPSWIAFLVGAAAHDGFEVW